MAWSSWAVTNTTAGLFGHVESSRAASMPVRSGIEMSRKTTSYATREASASASRTDAASPTTSTPPIRSSRYRSSARAGASSSTISASRLTSWPRAALALPLRRDDRDQHRHDGTEQGRRHDPEPRLLAVERRQPLVDRRQAEPGGARADARHEDALGDLRRDPLAVVAHRHAQPPEPHHGRDH